MATEEKVSKEGKPYKLSWIMIPDGNGIDSGSKRVFSLLEWYVYPDKDFPERRYSRLDSGRMHPVFAARGIKDSFSIDRDQIHLSSAEELVEAFRKYDRKPFVSRKPVDETGSDRQDGDE